MQHPGSAVPGGFEPVSDAQAALVALALLVGPLLAGALLGYALRRARGR
ncbi:MAG: hypothetical protein JWM10_5184, partial [Myxococcaceae bacterium]|nr:hypothetical protein [Myxococcaceae bacterium]